MVHEGVLERRQGAVVLQALDGRDLGSDGLHGQREARARRRTVHQDGAAPAPALMAGGVGARQPRALAQDVGEIGPRFDDRLDLFAVDAERDQSLCGCDAHAAAPAVAGAGTRARASRNATSSRRRR